jgi:hypothetical protein
VTCPALVDLLEHEPVRFDLQTHELREWTDPLEHLGGLALRVGRHQADGPVAERE